MTTSDGCMCFSGDHGHYATQWRPWSGYAVPQPNCYTETIVTEHIETEAAAELIEQPSLLRPRDPAPQPKAAAPQLKNAAPQPKDPVPQPKAAAPQPKDPVPQPKAAVPQVKENEPANDARQGALKTNRPATSNVDQRSGDREKDIVAMPNLARRPLDRKIEEPPKADPIEPGVDVPLGRNSSTAGAQPFTDPPGERFERSRSAQGRLRFGPEPASSAPTLWPVGKRLEVEPSAAIQSRIDTERPLATPPQSSLDFAAERPALPEKHIVSPHVAGAADQRATGDLVRRDAPEKATKPQIASKRASAASSEAIPLPKLSLISPRDVVEALRELVFIPRTAFRTDRSIRLTGAIQIPTGDDRATGPSLRRAKPRDTSIRTAGRTVGMLQVQQDVPRAGELPSDESFRVDIE